MGHYGNVYANKLEDLKNSLGKRQLPKTEGRNVEKVTSLLSVFFKKIILFYFIIVS